ncbi:MAG TPA: hypothetical protein DCG49_12375 [Ruminococcus sp.]|nr:hypothetical protein [Ruminococcus sp.]
MKYRNRLKAVLSVALLCGALAACGMDPAQTPSESIQQPSVSEYTDDLIDAQTAFTLNLLREATKENPGENVLLSPYSAMQSLAMTANGASGNTLSEMTQVLGLPPDQLNEALCAQRIAMPDSRACKFSLANALWVNAHAGALRDAFQQTNETFYNAKITVAPFSQSTVKDINKWCKKQTDGMIPEILTDQSTDHPAMHLLNAIAFDGEWDEKFAEEPQAYSFWAYDGSEQVAMMMCGTEKYYLSDEKATGFLKYYKDGKYAFAAIKPNNDVLPDAYLENLTAAELHSLLVNITEPRSVTIGLPKFRWESSNDLIPLLKNMGMNAAFDPDAADFSMMTENQEQLWISDVLQKAVIEVDTNGTKAVAVTKTSVESSLYDENTGVFLNRPFIYMIVETENMTPVFAGVINTMFDAHY